MATTSNDNDARSTRSRTPNDRPQQLEQEQQREGHSTKLVPEQESGANPNSQGPAQHDNSIERGRARQRLQDHPNQGFVPTSIQYMDVDDDEPHRTDANREAPAHDNSAPPRGDTIIDPADRAARLASIEEWLSRSIPGSAPPDVRSALRPRAQDELDQRPRSSTGSRASSVQRERSRRSSPAGYSVRGGGRPSSPGEYSTRGNSRDRSVSELTAHWEEDSD